MDDNKENRLSMFLKVKSHLAGNVASYNPITGFPELYSEYQTKINQIFTLNILAETDTTGYAEAKADKRQQLIDAMTTVYRGMAGYAASIGNKQILRKVDITNSELIRMRDTELYTASKLLIEIPTNINDYAILEPFHVTATSVNDLTSISDQYLALLPSPAEQAGKKSEALIEIDTIFKRIDTLLGDKLDYMAASLAVQFSTVYGNYQQVRVIDDTGASTPATHTGTVNAGEMLLIAAYVYSPIRSFRFKNEGTEPLNFGLGNDIITILPPGVIVAPNAQSTRLSSNLAPSGDNLLVQNTGIAPANFKIWVEEG